MSGGYARFARICALTVCAAAGPAQAQFFGFGAPQQINTARGAIQLAPGWHVATTPVRAGQGYRVAVRSDYGEQRNMFIGADGALAVESAPRAGVMLRAPSRPLKVEQAPKKAEAQKPRVKLAVIKAPAKPSTTSAAPAREVKPASTLAPVQNSKAPLTLTNDANPTGRGLDPSAPQAPGFAHGVPINPLD